MSTPQITISLAAEEDAPRLAVVMTAAFASSDAAYPLIWGNAPTHETAAEKGLFTPVQKEARVTYKAVTTDNTLVGFATWTLPKEKIPVKDVDKKEESGLPPIPGVNMELWSKKSGGTKPLYERDVDPSKDMFLNFFFVDPQYQRRGIGSLLLEWGKKIADKLQSKFWVTATPQAVGTYEKNGWKIMERHEIQLDKWGGEGVYSRAWMLREPWASS